MTQFRLDTTGTWSGGGRAFLSNWAYAAGRYPHLNSTDRDAVLVIPRNIPAARTPHRPYVIAPQNAWPWHPVTEGLRERLLVTSLRLGSAVYGRAARAQLRIADAIPAYFAANRTSPVIPNVLDEGFEDALEVSTRTDPLEGSAGAFVSLGSFNSYRNFDRLAKAYCSYRELGGSRGLVIAGPPANRAISARLAGRTVDGLTVLPQALSRPVCLATLRAAHAVVLPSLVEASPLSALEAVGSNPHVLLSDIVGHHEILQRYGPSNARHFFDPEDSQSIARALLSVDGDTAPPHPGHALINSAATRATARDNWADAVVSFLDQLPL